jgi:hypothetical protein
MTGQRTAKLPRVTEHHKARARVILLTLIGLICPPLAGVRSAPVWLVYLVFVILYSLWSLRLSRSFAGDRRLGYLLCLTDVAILLPLLVWSSSAAMQAVLVAVCASGLIFTYWTDGMGKRAAAGDSRDAHSRMPGVGTDRHEGEGMEAPLERALSVRLQVLDATETRFALVVLRVMHFEEMGSYYGEEIPERLLAAVRRRGMRLLGPDAQNFVLPGGRVAFVFATGGLAASVGATGKDTFEWIDPYDVESFAMALGHKACEHLVEGHRIECVVGWASAPADGVTAEDLLFAAESGAESAAAFRRVAGSRVNVPEKSRAAAG